MRREAQPQGSNSCRLKRKQTGRLQQLCQHQHACAIRRHVSKQ